MQEAKGGNSTEDGSSWDSLTITGSYDPANVEKRQLEFWEKEVPYRVDAKAAINDCDSKKFVMVIPPPNVTGVLHLGHTMMAAIEDSLTRWNRMLGKHSLWIPGLDHAGIATQTVVEKNLAVEGISRHDLGREKFIEKVMEWREEKGGRILYQLRRLGCSCDWSREAFTMSEELSNAVTEAFVRLHEMGLIYRDNRLVSWSPYLNTALSDIEVDLDEIEKPDRTRVPGFDKTVEIGMLWQFKYMLKNDPTKFIEVATTRIETMLGDVAVAVNPGDIRYKDMIGQPLVHPFFPDREIFIIGDDYCDPEYGTGAVKITPAHDKNDWEVGKRNGLNVISIFTLNGHINALGGKYAGLHRFEARLRLEKDLESMGLLTGKVKNPKKMVIPRCSRSNDIVEYMLIPQWYVDCRVMAQRAGDAVRNKSLTILPEGSDKQWYYWLDNIRDWCVSRQLWWGHRIPAYLVKNKRSNKVSEDTPNKATDETDSSELWVVGRNVEEAQEKAKTKLGHDDFSLEQDPDVLDTWFSAGLFPLSTLGWPNIKDNDDFKAFFPTTLLETGSDIIFFWVARMVMMSLTLVNELPFSSVYLHPMVRDSHGKKMSKSLGNIIDPVDVINGISLDALIDDVKKSGATNQLKDAEIQRSIAVKTKEFPKGIEECGADALRFGLLAYLKGGKSVNLDINRVVGYKHFCNKLWNACKLSLSYFKAAVDIHTHIGEPDLGKSTIIDFQNCHWSDKWILSRSSYCAKKAMEAFETYDFETAVSASYSHWLYEFCDVYLELVKPRLASLVSRQDSTQPNASEARELTASQKCALNVMFIVIERGLRVLHPLIPFVTEELWQRMMCVKKKQGTFGNDRIKSISQCAYPTYVPSWDDNKIEEEQSSFMHIVRHFRSTLAQFEVNPKNKLNAFLKIDSTQQQRSQMSIDDKTDDIAILSKLQSVKIVSEMPSGLITSLIIDGLLGGLQPDSSVEFKAVEKKFTKRLAELTLQIGKIEKKMSAPDYTAKVPLDVQSKDKDSLIMYQAEEESLKAALKTTQEFL